MPPPQLQPDLSMEETMANFQLTVAEVTRLAGCHRSTVVRFEERGYISSRRDHNNFRRYSKSDAKKLRTLLRLRNEVDTNG